MSKEEKKAIVNYKFKTFGEIIEEHKDCIFAEDVDLNNYISKDKIKAKINELEYDQLYEPNKIDEDRFKIEILKELLEEK